MFPVRAKVLTGGQRANMLACATPTQTRAALVRGHGLTALWQLDGAAEQQHAAWLARQEQWGHGCQLDLHRTIQGWRSYSKGTQLQSMPSAWGE